MFYYTLILKTLAGCCMGEYTGLRGRKGNLSDQGHNRLRNSKPKASQSDTKAQLFSFILRADTVHLSNTKQGSILSLFKICHPFHKTYVKVHFVAYLLPDLPAYNEAPKFGDLDCLSSASGSYLKYRGAFINICWTNDTLVQLRGSLKWYPLCAKLRLGGSWLLPHLLDSPSVLLTLGN